MWSVEEERRNRLSGLKLTLVIDPEWPRITLDAAAVAGSKKSSSLLDSETQSKRQQKALATQTKTNHTHTHTHTHTRPPSFLPFPSPTTLCFFFSFPHTCACHFPHHHQHSHATPPHALSSPSPLPQPEMSSTLMAASRLMLRSFSCVSDHTRTALSAHPHAARRQSGENAMHVTLQRVLA